MSKNNIDDIEVLIETHESELNAMLNGMGYTAVIYETDEEYEDCSEDDPYYGSTMYEAYIEADDGETVDGTTTGRYCDISSVIGEISATAKMLVKNQAIEEVAEKIIVNNAGDYVLLLDGEFYAYEANETPRCLGVFDSKDKAIERITEACAGICLATGEDIVFGSIESKEVRHAE